MGYIEKHSLNLKNIESNLFSKSAENKVNNKNILDFNKSIKKSTSAISFYLRENPNKYNVASLNKQQDRIVDSFLSKNENIIKSYKNNSYSLFLTNLGIYEFEYDKLLKSTDVTFHPKKAINEISFKLNSNGDIIDIKLNVKLSKKISEFKNSEFKSIFKDIKEYYL